MSESKSRYAPRAAKAVLGSLVADAATLGLEWIYDPAYVQKVAGDAPEFHTPDAKVYEGKPAYFAHGRKKVGELTDYGAALLFALEHASQTEGKINRAKFERAFATHFGPGGNYVGYINHVTKELLRNIDDSNRALPGIIETHGASLSSEDAGTIKSKVGSAAGSATTTAELVEAAKKAVAEAKPDNADLQAATTTIATAYGEQLFAPKGISDNQLIGTVRVPVLVAEALAQGLEGQAFDDYIEQGTSLTHNQPVTAIYALFLARWLRDVIQGQDVLASASKYATAEALGSSDDAKAVLEQLTQALTLDPSTDPVAQQAKYGLPCYVRAGIPGTLFLLRHHLAKSGGQVTEQTFIDVTRDNIRSGGDCSGRSHVSASIIAAALNSVPAAWLAKLDAQVVARAAKAGVQ